MARECFGFGDLLVSAVDAFAAAAGQTIDPDVRGEIGAVGNKVVSGCISINESIQSCDPRTSSPPESARCCAFGELTPEVDGIEDIELYQTIKLLVRGVEVLVTITAKGTLSVDATDVRENRRCSRLNRCKSDLVTFRIRLTFKGQVGIWIKVGDKLEFARMMTSTFRVTSKPRSVECGG